MSGERNGNGKEQLRDEQREEILADLRLDRRLDEQRKRLSDRFEQEILAAHEKMERGEELTLEEQRLSKIFEEREFSAAVAEKVDRGEELTPEEQERWEELQKMDEIAKKKLGVDFKKGRSR